jgi:hypothetical protein
MNGPSARTGVKIVAKKGLPKSPAPSFPLGGEEVPSLIRHLESARMEHSVRVSDGWLVGYNAGEFGAVVLWYSADGKKSREVSRHHVNQFHTTTDGVFAATGLYHLGLGRGAVVRFSHADGKWDAKALAELPEAAYALVQSERGTLLVVTDERLLRVADGNIETLTRGFHGWVANPNSIAIDPRGAVYVGMGQFVGKYDPAESERGLQLLAPAKGFPRPRK